MSNHDNLEEYQDPAEYDIERITISLAQRGYAMTGIDISHGMVERARQKTQGTGLPVRWLVGDCTRFELGEQFRLIFMTGHSFQHFLDRASQEALTNTQEEVWHSYLDPAGNQVTVSG